MTFADPAARQVDSRRVFVIAGPAMLANLATPLLGVVSTGAIGQLGDAALLGGVALASVAFDCVFWLFGFLRMATVAFTAQALGADDRIEIRAVLYNFLMIGSFFLDGLANAAEQLCGQTFGARDRAQFARAVRLVLAWSVGFGVVVSLIFIAAGDHLIDIITTSPDVRLAAREFMWLAALAPACGVMAYCFDGVFIGASWARDMRNLMVMAFVIYIAVWYALTPWGNAGLWTAFLAFLLARGLLQAMRYPALVHATFRVG